MGVVVNLRHTISYSIVYKGSNEGEGGWLATHPPSPMAYLQFAETWAHCLVLNSDLLTDFIAGHKEYKNAQESSTLAS